MLEPPSQAEMSHLTEQVVDIQSHVQHRMEEVLNQVGSPLRAEAAYYPSNRGKMFRASVAIMMAERVCPERRWEATTFAAAIEMLHNFTLVHDDIMDRDTMRRGKKTLHEVWGEPTAILAGDVLFALVFKLLARSCGMQELRIVEEVAESTQKIACGQKMDIDKPRTCTQYDRMIALKTAELFRIAAWGGALLVGGDREEVEHADEYGYNLGMAFQYWDDYLDFRAGPDRGKDHLSDLRQAKASFPLLYAASVDRDLQNLPSMLPFDMVEKIVGRVEATGALDKCRSLAQMYAEKAVDMTCEGPLRTLAKYSVTRER